MGSNPAEAVRIFQGEKILSMPFFGGEVSCWSHVVDLRHVKDPQMAWKSSFRQNYWTTFSPTGSLASLQEWRHLVAEVGMSKRGRG